MKSFCTVPAGEHNSVRSPSIGLSIHIKPSLSLSSVTNKGLEEILNKVLNVIKKNKQVEEVEKWSP